MPLRPIDAIFVHPQERYYVIYQAGKLHRLTRMKLDFSSWQRRSPYKGSEDDVYLIKNQSISDDRLSQILHTQDLPDNLHGRSLASFKLWWRMNGYRWMQEMEDNPIDEVPETEIKAPAQPVSSIANQDKDTQHPNNEDSLFPARESSKNSEQMSHSDSFDDDEDDEVMLLDDDDVVVLDDDDIVDDVNVVDLITDDESIIDDESVNDLNKTQSKTKDAAETNKSVAQTDSKSEYANTPEVKPSVLSDDNIDGNVDDDFFDNLLDEWIK